MKGIRRIRQRLCALPLALACLMGLAACGGPDFGSFSKELEFGDKQISDTQTTYVMKIPEGKLGDLIGPSQIQWVIDQYGDPPAHTGAVAVGTKKAAKDLLRKSPELQCRALENTYQEESSDEGKWEYKDSSCRKQRKLSWLEKTLWNMYQVQSDSTIEWLSTSRNTLVAANDTVSTLQANATPNYDSWFAPVNRYLRIAQGVLVAAAAISLIVLSARIVWNIGQGGEGRLLDRIGWILLGVLLGSSCASIALTFFSRSSGGNPDLPSWTPGGGTTFFLSDYIRMQVDPFLIIAAVCGVIAAGWKLVTQQEGRDLIPLGKAFMWAILSAVCLAGLVNTFQATFDTWTADVLRSASGMMNDAWESKSLAASSFFNLGAPVAIVLTIVMWICGLISKIFAYFRAGMLPILVGVAPMWAAMSWMETGKQAFAKTIGWLAAFLAYKPVAALVMATGSAIMATAGPGDDSQAITLMLTLSVIILLPAMIRVIVPAVQSSVGGGGGGILPSILGMGVAVAGGGLRKAMGGKGGRKGGDSGGGEASPDGAKPGAGRGLAGLLSGLGRGDGKPQGTNGFAGIGHDAGDEAHLNAPQQSRHRLAATWTGSTFTFSYDLSNPAGRTDGSRMTFGAPVTRTAVLTYDKNAADASGQVPSNTTPDTTQTASSKSTGKVSDLVQRTTTHEDGSVTVKTIDTSTDVVSGCQVYYPAGQKITLATMAKDDDCWDSSMLSRPGHTQLGWNQDRNATQAQAQVTMVEGGMTVYAVWVGNPVLTYDTNKPSTWSGQMPSTPASVSVPYNAPAADGSGWRAGDTTKIRGYRFLGWYTGPQDNAGLYDWTRPLTGSVTVYAHWQRLQANVVYNANGGTGSHPNTTGWQYSDVTIPGDTSKSFKRDKYVFKGWGTKPGKADVAYKDGSKVALQDKDITLYAQWQEVHENFVETGGIGLPIAIAGGVLLLMFGIGSTVMLTRRMNGHGMPDNE